MPGGTGTRREVCNTALTGWIAGVGAEWITSVCTGALLLHEAGHPAPPYLADEPIAP